MGWSIHHPIGLIYYAPQHCYLGYTLVTTTGGNHATLIDMEGRVCHRWYSEKGIPHAFLLPNGNLLCRMKPPADVEGMQGFGGSSAGLFELDWDGNVLWEYNEPLLHHDFVRLPNGNTLTFVWQKLSAELTSQVRGGYTTDEDPEQMFGDLVREIAPDGSVVDEWWLWKHLTPEEDVICPLEGRREWTHGNSLDLTPEGDFLISFRQTSTVTIVDRASGEFRWKWGPNELSHQHNATYLDNGHVLIFDNGPHRRGPSGSRVIEVDPTSNEIAWEYKGTPPISFFSFHVSGAERLPNGNTLVCEGGAGRLFELTPNKELVWEYINPFFVPDSRFGSVTNASYRAHRYGPEHPALKGKDLDPNRHANLNRLYIGG